jgi:hypothetical protein
MGPCCAAAAEAATAGRTAAADGPTTLASAGARPDTSTAATAARQARGRPQETVGLPPGGPENALVTLFFTLSTRQCRQVAARFVLPSRDSSTMKP